MSFEEVRNTLVIALAEGSFSEEEFPILYEKYESINPLYPYWEFDAFCLANVIPGLEKDDILVVAEALQVLGKFRCSQGAMPFVME